MTTPNTAGGPTPTLATLVKEYRPTMAGDVLHAWASDILVALARQEPVAFCEPDNPLNSSAFAWPGTDREPRHTTPLYAAPVAERPAVDLEQFRDLVREWCDRATQHLDSADPDDEDDVRLHQIMAGAVGGCASQLRALINSQKERSNG